MHGDAADPADVARTFGFMARRARGCPSPLWWLSAGRPFVLVTDAVTKDSVLSRVHWGRQSRIAVARAGATVDVSYVAHNWSNANKASFTVVPGDMVEYRATWWPWQRGRYAIRHTEPRE